MFVEVQETIKGVDVVQLVLSLQRLHLTRRGLDVPFVDLRDPELLLQFIYGHFPGGFVILGTQGLLQNLLLEPFPMALFQVSSGPPVLGGLHPALPTAQQAGVELLRSIVTRLITVYFW
jgi:hypothetical protein